ncbi:glycoprotein-N-acetylgalactosamine 3-beta-galactosyltransferase 1-B-like isoform X1 [Physella acuta]|uniref:glycoprotein-N-acetylgalactosamine 3-beta-galactosyltransferase 1-B-like isoform X1 n=1 Tax=Physella acuta TaxID=109671 RepID=UPI0027DBF99F|nr:glycoprotein-N-acetylgalactosamine 3-beta-galactosyltransferase 1-B-like isoform X1 [Physella acuta]
MILQSMFRVLVIGIFSGLIFTLYTTTNTRLFNTFFATKSINRTETTLFNDRSSGIVNDQNHRNAHEGEFKQNEDESTSRKLADDVRVLVWVMTSPSHLPVQAKAVKDTWARHGQLVLYFSSIDNKTFPAIGLNVSEGREHLTAKTMKAFRYIYENHFNDADWFVKADDDTYLIIENLKYFLSGENYSEPVYFGQLFLIWSKPGLDQVFPCGGAGYVLSKEALRRFGEGARQANCAGDYGGEDIRMALCLEKLVVRAGRNHDALGNSRFHQETPAVHINGLYRWWYYNRSIEAVRKGVDGLSDYTVSFHHVTPADMYMLEFFIYHLRPYGIPIQLQELNNKTFLSKLESVRTFPKLISKTAEFSNASEIT